MMSRHPSMSMVPAGSIPGYVSSKAFEAYIRQLCLMMQTALHVEKVNFWLLNPQKQDIVCVEDIPWPERLGFSIPFSHVTDLFHLFTNQSFVEFPQAHQDVRLRQLPIQQTPHDLLMAHVYCELGVQGMLVCRKSSGQAWPVNYVSLVGYFVELAAQAMHLFQPHQLNWQYLHWQQRLNQWAHDVMALSGSGFFDTFVQHLYDEFEQTSVGLIECIPLNHGQQRLRVISERFITVEREGERHVSHPSGALFRHIQLTGFAPESRLPDGQQLRLIALHNANRQVIGYLFLLFGQDAQELALLQQLLAPLLPRLESELARYQAEAALKLSSIAFDTNKGCLITDERLVILKVNKAFAQITGIAEEQAVGQKLGEDIWSLSESQYFACLQGREWTGKITRVRQDGQLYPQWESWTPVLDENHQLRHFVLCVEDLTEQVIAHRRIHELAYYDELTGLANRRRLLELVNILFQETRKKGYFGAILFIDLDHFKDINDSLGHAAGDAILQQVSHRLQPHFHDQSVFARLGGDEFVAFIPDIAMDEATTAVKSRCLAEALLRTLDVPFQYENKILHTGASIGIALYPTPGQTPSDLLKQADTAMYQAKAQGRGCVRVFHHTMQRRVDRKLHIHNNLRDALSNRELSVHYQPQHQVASGQLWGVEALLRRFSVDGETLFPDEFIPVAEETDLIIDLGKWVLEESCRQYQQWHQKGIRLQQVSVNVSARQFHHADFVGVVKDVLQKTGIDPAVLMLEITESVVLESIENTIRKISELRQLGIRFAIDDFGKGYSSLSYLNRLPVHELKIDRAFIKDIPGNSSNMAIAEAVLAMARHLGFEVTAEGVETYQQLLFLRQQSCHAYQGFLASKPLPADVLEQYAIAHTSKRIASTHFKSL